jgi:hypothetical protein
MQIEKRTSPRKTLVRSAQDLARCSGHQPITPLHLLKAPLDAVADGELAINGGKLAQAA